jgi:hypothetical protein
LPELQHSDFEVDRMQVSCGIAADAIVPFAQRVTTKWASIPVEVFLRFDGDKKPIST